MQSSIVLKITVVWVVMPWRWVEIYHHVLATSYIHLKGREFFQNVGDSQLNNCDCLNLRIFYTYAADHMHCHQYNKF